MFFETANIKRVHASEKPPGKPIPTLRNTTSTTAPRPTTNTFAAPRRTNLASAATAPGHQVSKNAVRQNVQPPAAVLNPRRSFVNKVQKKVSAWPSGKKGIWASAFSKPAIPLKYRQSYINKQAVSQAQSLRAPVLYDKSGKRVYAPVSDSYYGKRRFFGAPTITQNPSEGWSVYRKGTGTPAYNLVRGWKTYYNNAAAPDTQSANIYLQGRSAGYTDQTIPAERAWQYNSDTPVQQRPAYIPISRRRACRICGCANTGCDTLSGFAVDNIQLNAVHKNQVNVLAQKILSQNIRSVTATGHTDATGSNDYNLKLGYRRAQNVIKAIINKMHLIKPYSEQNVFWKIKTRGKSKPISGNSTALNRRVEVCLR